MKYILFDDIGIMKEGTKQECISTLIEWTKTKEAKGLYSRSELENIKDVFFKILRTESFNMIEVSGFTLKRKAK